MFSFFAATGLSLPLSRLNETVNMHWLAKKMIAEFDTRDGHILFAKPFIDAIASKYGHVRALEWVSNIISPFTSAFEAPRVAHEFANKSLAAMELANLDELNQKAWSLWCGEFKGNQLFNKSASRYIWTVMGLICYHHDQNFLGHLSALEFTGRNDEQLSGSMRNAASAVNLAFNQELAQSRNLQRELAVAFSCEMERLGDSAG